MKKRWYKFVLWFLDYMIVETMKQIDAEEQKMNNITNHCSMEYMDHWRRQFDLKIQLEKMTIKELKYQGKLRLCDS